MMASPELVVLDVGHGNCAIVRYDNSAIVIDAPANPVVNEALDAMGIENIEALLLSHADVDHISGAIGLLANSQRPIGSLWVNPDASKSTQSWKEFRRAIRDASGRTKCNNSLSSTVPGVVKFFEVAVEVLYPTPDVALAGIGGRDLEGRGLTSNSMSAVIRLMYQGQPLCLFAGDMDQAALENLRASGSQLAAPLLVFPHHGGRPGRAKTLEFAKEVTALTKPDVVLISLGRNKHDNPRPEVIAGIREATGSQAHIACTQLSRQCALKVPDQNPVHLMRMPADGQFTRECCAGSVVVPLNGSNTRLGLVSLLSPHRKFVESSVPKGLCRK